MKILNTIQSLSFILNGIIIILILGAEPGTSESSMYEYEHVFDTGHVGWILGWGWVVTLGLIIMSTTLIVINNKHNRAKH
jgi:hypothetical protein